MLPAYVAVLPGLGVLVVLLVAHRLRPSFVTTPTTVIVLLPMALAVGVGTEANQPLAIAVIGGLLVSTFCTLVLIPTLYVILQERFPRELARSEEPMPA